MYLEDGPRKGWDEVDQQDGEGKPVIVCDWADGHCG